MTRCRRCSRPVPDDSPCGCCCANCDSVPARRRTDGGPSLREFLESKGEA